MLRHRGPPRRAEAGREATHGIRRVVMPLVAAELRPPGPTLRRPRPRTHGFPRFHEVSADFAHGPEGC
ncbi:hypothetical protein AB0E21_05990 [Streptomyces sp. NPDC047967]|uniref:hypothetical protein n=1 Tax=Streptomyces sp. NPDC047967 TaxID=3154924 RepID=UPI0033EE5B3B